MDPVYKLKGVVQHYAWGGSEFIPQLLGVNNPERKPFGEYWLGAHPNAPSVLEQENINLQQFIADHPAATLGEPVAAKFGSLPYLFKILDVKQMLSIQVHPSKEAAAEEFEKENKKGIPVNAPNRNYKDKNHKPELMLALSDFWLLHGFKQERELIKTLEDVAELGFLLSSFKDNNYKGLYEEVMTMPQEKVNEVLAPLLQRIIPLYQKNSLPKSTEDFWAARAALNFCKDGQYDRGIFSIYLFNLLNLKEGEAIYQPAGLPHAYLEGQNVEVMANSDNVLRAGLTEKHVDVTELMKHVKFEPTVPNVIRPNGQTSQAFTAPVEEFLLTRYDVSHTVNIEPVSATIVFFYDAAGNLSSGQKTIEVARGEAALALPGQRVSLKTKEGKLTVFTVSTPLDKN